MSVIFTNVNKPNAKNPIKNYVDHAVYLFDKYNTENQKLGLLRTKNFNKTCELMKPLALKRLTFFHPLRDGHDYTDEVMGVLITPALLLASLTMLIKSMYHGVASWMPNNAYMKKDKHKHAGESADNLYVACLTLFVAINNGLISATSLVTRPIATVVHGIEEQNTPRFRV